MNRNNLTTLKNLETLNHQNRKQILFISHKELSNFTLLTLILPFMYC